VVTAWSVLIVETAGRAGTRGRGIDQIVRSFRLNVCDRKASRDLAAVDVSRNGCVVKTSGNPGYVHCGGIVAERLKAEPRWSIIAEQSASRRPEVRVLETGIEMPMRPSSQVWHGRGVCGNADASSGLCCRNRP